MRGSARAGDHAPSPARAEPRQGQLPMPSILKINGISKRFPGVQALQDVTFEVQVGSIHAVIGENGAGKSNLMQVIAGVHQPDAGTIEFCGEPAKFADPITKPHMKHWTCWLAKSAS